MIEEVKGKLEEDSSIFEIKKCLESEKIPESSEDCEYCCFVKKQGK